jgi:hypothetical protein
MFSDQLFEGNSLVSVPKTPVNIQDIPIMTDKTIECEIKVKVLVSNSAHSEEFLCVHRHLSFKRFGSFKGVPVSQVPTPKGFVKFEVNDRPNRIMLWAEKVFNIDQSNQSVESSANGMRMSFIDVKTGKPLIISAETTPGGLSCNV